MLNEEESERGGASPAIVSKWTGFPCFRNARGRRSSFGADGGSSAAKRFLGRNEALIARGEFDSSVRVRDFERSEAGPIGFVLFLFFLWPPTGVGKKRKTALVRLAEFLFDYEDCRWVRIDMSEYREKHCRGPPVDFGAPSPGPGVWSV